VRAVALCARAGAESRRGRPLNSIVRRLLVEEKALEIGNTYFTVFYADRQLKQPVVKTYIYLGLDQSETDRQRPIEHLFQTARSFHQQGNWNQMSEAERSEYDVAPLLLLNSESLEAIVDVSGLVREMNDVIARGR
jgi:hypothetical protein